MPSRNAVEMSHTPVPDLKPLSLKPWLQVLIVLAVAAAGGAFWHRQAREADGAEPRARPTLADRKPDPSAAFVLTGDQLATLTVETVVQRQFFEEIQTEGKIGVDEYRSTPVFSPYPGRVVTIFARTGEQVKQGQKLFSLQANEMVQAQNDYLAALNIVNKARSQFGFA